MKNNYTLAQQFIARILLISLCLQSCSGGFNNHPLILNQEEQIASIQTNTQAIVPQTDIGPLLYKQFTADGGHAVSFYEEYGDLKADVEMNAYKGFSKTYEGVEVTVEQGVELAKLSCLDTKAQERRIRLQLAHAGKPAKIVIYKGSGLIGGGKDKGKEKELEFETDEKETSKRKGMEGDMETQIGQEIEKRRFEEDEETYQPDKNNLECKEEKVNINTSTSQSQTQEKDDRLILSLDGGGIRGILEADALNHIEKALSTKILAHFGNEPGPSPAVRLGECFDLIAGTSTGGIIALAMRVVDPITNRPYYNMETVSEIYKDKGNKIFYGNSTFWKLLWQAKSNIYNPKPLEDILADYFGKATLKDLNSPTLVTSYDTKKQTIHFFSSHEAKNDSSKNFYLKDVARSTSAAPTYFSPANINNMCEKQYCFIDGGVAANNPALHAYIYAKDNLYLNSRCHVISLGTGTAQKPSLAPIGGVRLLPKLVGIVIDNNSKAVEACIQSILAERKGDTYTRLEFEIDHQTAEALDNASPNNLEKLVRYAQNTVEKEEDGILKTIVDKLEDYYAAREYYVFHSLVKEVRKQLQSDKSKVNLAKIYLQSLGLPYICERATWEISHALSLLPMARLTYLNLSGNKLIAEDNSLLHLSKLSGLAYLDISDTNLTIDGLVKLKDANLCLDILKAQNNPALHNIKSNMLATKIGNYKISYLDSDVMEDLASYYSKQGQSYEADLMFDMADDSEFIGVPEWHLGRKYENGWGVEEDDRMAIEWYRKSAKQGNAKAQIKLGQSYHNGVKATKSKQEATKWYKKAAKQGNQIAQHALFSIYQKAAARQCDDSIAEYNLGKMYYNGWGIDQNYNKAFGYFEKAAEKGDLEAQFNLGVMYQHGEGAAKDDLKAVEWYEKAADQRHATAQFMLGGMYETGEGIEKNYEESFKWYQKVKDKYGKLAEEGHVDAQNILANMYYNGKGVVKDFTMAFEWFQKAADQGHADAQYRLGCMYEKGEGLEKDDRKALFWYEKAADQGHAEAQYSLGDLFEKFRREEPTEDICLGFDDLILKAIKWYKKAANQGHAESAYRLSNIYKDFYNTGVCKLKTIIQYYKKAANQGHIDAQVTLGKIYFHGFKIYRDDYDKETITPCYQRAFKWYKKAADQGHVGAQFYLGWMYEDGLWVEKNEITAKGWYQMAADQRHIDARYNLAGMYYNGKGVVQDFTMAFGWYEKAANQGHVDAQSTLGWMYQHGIGVEKDEAAALKWFQKAADQGYDKARKALERFRNFKN